MRVPCQSWFSRWVWILLAAVMLYPLAWTVMSSFKASNMEVFEHPFSLPLKWTTKNYSRAVAEGRMGDYLVNSLWVTGLSTVATVMFGVWAGYSLSKPKFPFQRFWLGLF